MELLIIVIAGLIAMALPISGQSQQPEITGKDGASMMLIPAGEFTMGSNEGADEKPVHRVSLDAYYMDKYEVTVGQFLKFLEATSMDALPEWNIMNQPPHQKRPVVNVNWSAASTYCRWAGKRLPTEAEWEKAARGTDGRMYPWGNAPPDRLRANYGEREWTNHMALVPVGQLEDGKSLYGIYDLAGNVWEWVSDWYDKNYYKNSPSENPKGPERGEDKVLRGGSWFDLPVYLRSANRSGFTPSFQSRINGFRCAKTP